MNFHFRLLYLLYVSLTEKLLFSFGIMMGWIKKETGDAGEMKAPNKLPQKDKKNTIVNYNEFLIMTLFYW